MIGVNWGGTANLRNRHSAAGAGARHDVLGRYGQSDPCERDRLPTDGNTHSHMDM